MESFKRRNFIKGALATGGMLLATPYTGKGSVLEALREVKEDAPIEPIRTSIMCYSFHQLLSSGVMDVFGFLESCKYRYDVQACDLWNGFLKSTEDEYLKKVRFGLDDRDLKCSSLAWDPAVIWSNTAEGRERAYQAALVGLKAGKILGANLVRIDAGGGMMDKEWSNEAFDHIVKTYKEYCQYAYDNGFKVGPEIHWGPETYSENMIKLSSAVDHPGYGIIQMTHQYKGTPAEIIAGEKETAKWACATHLKWDCIEDGTLEERMGILRDAGFRGYYGVEYHPQVNAYANVGVMIAKVKAVLEKWRDAT